MSLNWFRVEYTCKILKMKKKHVFYFKKMSLHAPTPIRTRIVDILLSLSPANTHEHNRIYIRRNAILPHTRDI